MAQKALTRATDVIEGAHPTRSVLLLLLRRPGRMTVAVCAFALKEGRKEGKYESLQESLVIMQVMDEVRKQNGMTYPDKIESLEYPLKL